MPIVYILTNDSMPDTIKIGITNNLEQRVKQLDTTSVALPFVCYYAVEVPDDASAIEKRMHEGLDEYRIRQNREFFKASPELAKSLLNIAEIMGGRNVTPSDDIVETPQDKQALDEARRARKRFNFQMLDIKEGTILYFKKDYTITCEVVNDTQVNFRGEIMSLSRSAEIILREMGYDWETYAGTLWWCLDSDGKTLDDIRKELE